MASGWGITGNKGRCYDFWMDFSECMSRCREPRIVSSYVRTISSASTTRKSSNVETGYIRRSSVNSEQLQNRVRNMEMVLITDDHQQLFSV